MTADERRVAIARGAEEIAKPINDLLGRVVVKGTKGILDYCIELQETIKRLEAENARLRKEQS